MNVGSFLDKLIAPVFPGWAARRQMARLRHITASEMLSTYQAADKGRRNKDWVANMTSADGAIIADAATVNNRARQMLRDNWAARSAQRAITRNVVGRGILPVPAAKGPDGKELADLNAFAEAEFWRWASNKAACDIEKRSTFWAKQAMVMDEYAAVGEHWVAWSYVPSPDFVGLRLQSIEPEQLDDTRITADNGNEIRGGVEVDENGAEVAIHIFRRNQADYLPRKKWESYRLPADRYWHFYRPERTLQTRALSIFAPVLQDMKDYRSYDTATLWRAIMESCIGLLISSDAPPVNQTTGNMSLGLQPRASGDTGTTASGIKTIDFHPGMVWAGRPGEEPHILAPQSPGNQYEPFTMSKIRAMAAGIGTSFEQVARDFSRGTYSSQRQGMLEDRKEWEVLQDLLIDNLIMPIYELWFKMAVVEGRFARFGVTPETFFTEPARYTEAEYIPPAQPWIDPLKEITAHELALKNFLKTRKEITAEAGGRFRRILEQRKDERQIAASLGITFPEDQQPTVSQAPPNTAKPAGGTQDMPEDMPDQDESGDGMPGNDQPE